MENKLLSCPFCGGEVLLDIGNQNGEEADQWFVICQCCAAEGPWFHERGNAITAWNTRARPEEVKRLVEAAKGALELMLTDSTCFGLGVCKYYTECTRPDGECQFVLRLQAALAAVEEQC